MQNRSLLCTFEGDGLSILSWVNYGENLTEHEQISVMIDDNLEALQNAIGKHDAFFYQVWKKGTDIIKQSDIEFIRPRHDFAHEFYYKMTIQNDKVKMKNLFLELNKTRVNAEFDQIFNGNDSCFHQMF